MSDSASLAARLQASKSSSDVIDTTLQTDDRVLARVTDGIYRQPGSALRELISNAYDADASYVHIRTDRPRFERIIVEDDGLGMSPDTVAYLIHHIGGSAKRNPRGVELGVTSVKNPNFTPGGRRLIGKIGIGLFSVAQLTRTFQLITKREGDKFRTVATVVLKQYSDEDPDSRKAPYEAGRVKLWREPATDIDRSGTTIVLTGIRPQTRQALASNDFWSQLEAEEDEETSEGVKTVRREPPRIHIGRWIEESGRLRKNAQGEAARLPWSKSDDARTAFNRLVRGVTAEATADRPNARLNQLLDYYVHMVWQLALAVPAPYVEDDPFRIPISELDYAYLIPPDPKSPAFRLPSSQESAAQLLRIDPTNPGSDFVVRVDDLVLQRPVLFKNLPSTSHVITQPMFFFGTASESFDDIPVELSGGPLEFHAYLMWSPRIVPRDHQGCLVRIHGASGTLYDSTFMRYQVAELTRLQQTTCEIFVTRGLEGALNIDRESFNYSHPHVTYLTRWLHAALRRLATAQKAAAKELRQARHSLDAIERKSQLEAIVEQVRQQEISDDEQAAVPRVTIVDGADGPSGDVDSEAGNYRIRRSWNPPARTGGGAKQRQAAQHREAQVVAVLDVLAAFGLLEDLAPERADRLARAIIDVLEAGE